MESHSLTSKEYKSLFVRLFPSLCLFSNKYIEDLEVSKDIVQDVFIKIWEEQIEFHGGNTVKSYLYTSVKNRSLDYLKSRQFKMMKSIGENDFSEIENEPFFLREVLISDTSVLIENAINTLPPKCGAIIRLSIKGLTTQEISEELGISISTIKNQKQIAYKRLKPLLKDAFVVIAFVFELKN